MFVYYIPYFELKKIRCNWKYISVILSSTDNHYNLYFQPPGIKNGSKVVKGIYSALSLFKKL